jgi:hypothetical protein
LDCLLHGRRLSLDGRLFSSGDCGRIPGEL